MGRLLPAAARAASGLVFLGGGKKCKKLTASWVKKLFSALGNGTAAAPPGPAAMPRPAVTLPAAPISKKTTPTVTIATESRILANCQQTKKSTCYTAPHNQLPAQEKK